MADKIPFADYSGTMKELASGDKVPIANLATGTPDGTKFIRDDGTLVTPAGGSGMTWTEVTGTSQSAAVDNGYIANNAGLVTVTIPTTAAIGKIVEVVGKGAGGWKVAQNASEIIHFGNLNTTTGTGGSLASTHRYDSVRLLCTVADTEWTVIGVTGNLTIV